MPGAKAMGKLANSPMHKQPNILAMAVDVTYSRLISSKHASYSGLSKIPLLLSQGPPIVEVKRGKRGE
jgi:hypothetical protein